MWTSAELLDMDQPVWPVYVIGLTGPETYLTIGDAEDINLAKSLDQEAKAKVEDWRVPMKRTGFPKGEPDSLYRRDSPWISSYHIQNSFQLHITVALLDRSQYMGLIIHNPEDLQYDNQSTSPLG